ncbi:hypothetical protein NIES39_A06730 [Arthrospira platensis NIES-39]|nr:hypothetical protein NIES39_A06730 [Arthrospira platensis NIES-39]
MVRSLKFTHSQLLPAASHLNNLGVFTTHHSQSRHPPRPPKKSGGIRRCYLKSINRQNYWERLAIIR